jgi:LGFP repeat
MTEVRGERNDFSGEAHGHVVQAGVVHGDIRLDLSPDRIELLSARGLLVRLVKIPADEAAIKLATVDPIKAAEVIEMMPEARRIAIIPYMDAASATAILNRLPDDIAATLHLAIRAARSISSDAAKWHQLLGDALGDLRREESSIRSPAGFSCQYERGTVYWNQRTGTGMTSGAIEDRYGKFGGPSAWLGYPIGSEIRIAAPRFGTSGTRQCFEAISDFRAAALEESSTACGAVICASEKGAFAIHGIIGEYYESSEGIQGLLGFPTSSARPLRASGRRSPGQYRQYFEGGAVYSSRSTGVACVRTPLREVHEKNLPAYGLPIGDQQIAAPSRQGTTGIFQRFQGDSGAPDIADVSIYSSTSHGTWPVSGPILRAFERSGGTAGPFGFPTRPVFPHRWGDEQYFESGAILSSTTFAGGSVGVAGKVYILWCEHWNELGRPTTEERVLEDGPDLVQFFQHGVISVVDGAAKFWLLPPGD